MVSCLSYFFEWIEYCRKPEKPSLNITSTENQGDGNGLAQTEVNNDKQTPPAS
ncbi:MULTISPECIES: hypothetical protein [Vibrio]|uniref:Uncharacterized protein n=1 Tax=Vibrio kanaloae TaxID=170673 RepID=A0ABV4LGX7_9VIBR|nr:MULTISPECIES: hypothetical protein [Vibrio]MDA0143320.1 hypothetical protein [Vibrio sp. RW]